jgi:hypothetical protein
MRVWQKSWYVGPSGAAALDLADLVEEGSGLLGEFGPFGGLGLLAAGL